MAAYSMDLRTRVLRDSAHGMKADAVADKYQVSASWVRRLKQRRRETGEVTPRRQTRWRPPIWASHVGEVRDPEFVGPRGHKRPVDQVGRPRGDVRTGRRGERASPDGAPQAQLPHQAFDGAPSHTDPLAIQLAPDFVRAVDRKVFVSHATDLRLQPDVALRPTRSQLGFA